MATAQVGGARTYDCCGRRSKRLNLDRNRRSIDFVKHFVTITSTRILIYDVRASQQLRLSALSLRRSPIVSFYNTCQRSRLAGITVGLCSIALL